MSRPHFKDTVVDESGNAIRAAAVYLYQPGTTTDPAGVMYDAETSGNVITNPLLSNAQGEVEAFCDTPQSLDVLVTDNNGSAYYANSPDSGLLTFTQFSESYGGAFTPLVETYALRNIVVKTASYPIVATDLGTVFTNLGASGSVTFTLPATTGLSTGWWCRVYVVTNNTVVVATSTTDTLVVFNDLAADSISWATASQKIGNAAEFVWDGTEWLTFQYPSTTGGAQTVATVTIAT